jgi:hypothetical protein
MKKDRKSDRMRGWERASGIENLVGKIPERITTLNPTTNPSESMMAFSRERMNESGMKMMKIEVEMAERKRERLKIISLKGMPASNADVITAGQIDGLSEEGRAERRRMERNDCQGLGALIAYF